MDKANLFYMLLQQRADLELIVMMMQVLGIFFFCSDDADNVSTITIKNKEDQI